MAEEDNIKIKICQLVLAISLIAPLVLDIKPRDPVTKTDIQPRYDVTRTNIQTGNPSTKSPDTIRAGAANYEDCKTNIYLTI